MLPSLLVAAAALTFSASAFASPPAIAITSGPDPVESVTTQLGVSGSASPPASVVALHVKPVGGTVCGAGPESDDGSTVFAPHAVASTFGEVQNWTFGTAGRYLLCAWITDPSQPGSPTVASASASVEARQPVLSITIDAPSAVTAGTTFHVRTTARAEALRTLWVEGVADTGRGCPANRDAAHAQGQYLGIVYAFDVVGGPITLDDTLSVSTPGNYLWCGYFHLGASDSPPQATALARITVLGPCVVPSVLGLGRESALRALRAAGCRPFVSHRIRSRAYRKGRVVRSTPGAGSRLSPGAAVGIVVSSGRPATRRR